MVDRYIFIYANTMPSDSYVFLTCGMPQSAFLAVVLFFVAIGCCREHHDGGTQHHNLEIGGHYHLYWLIIWFNTRITSPVVVFW